MKPSVYTVNTTTKEPYYFLKLSKFAYDHAPVLREETQLMYASVMSVIYLGALRVSEATSLLKSQIAHATSNSGRPFILIDNLVTEKTEGRIRTVPLFQEDPLLKPLIGYLQLLDGRGIQEQRLFPITRFTPLNVVKRYTEEAGWTHWLRSQRISWLSSYLTPFELDSLGGWGAKKPKNPRDYYVHRQWRDYAEKVAEASSDYWARTQIEGEVAAWLSAIIVKQ